MPTTSPPAVTVTSRSAEADDPADHSKRHEQEPARLVILMASGHGAPPSPIETCRLAQRRRDSSTQAGRDGHPPIRRAYRCLVVLGCGRKEPREWRGAMAQRHQPGRHGQRLRDEVLPLLMDVGPTCVRQTIHEAPPSPSRPLHV